jgi:hypothetical protein
MKLKERTINRETLEGLLFNKIVTFPNLILAGMFFFVVDMWEMHPSLPMDIR